MLGRPSPVDLTAAKDDCEAMASYLNDRALKTIFKLAAGRKHTPRDRARIGKISVLC